MSRSTLLANVSMPGTKSAQRIPLRNLQNDMLQHSALSTTKPLSSNVTSKMKVEMANHKAQVLQSSPDACSALKNGIPLRETMLYREKSVAFEAVEDTLALLRDAQDSFRDDVCEVQSEPCHAQSISTDNGVGDITWKSFLCTGVQIEVFDSSRVSEKDVLSLTECPEDAICDISLDHSEYLGFLDHSALYSSSRHKDHNYSHVEKDETISRENFLAEGNPNISNTSQESGPLNGTGVSCQDFLECFPECAENMQGVSNVSSVLQQVPSGMYSTMQSTSLQSLCSDPAEKPVTSGTEKPQSNEFAKTLDTSVTATGQSQSEELPNTVYTSVTEETQSEEFTNTLNTSVTHISETAQSNPAVKSVCCQPLGNDVDGLESTVRDSTPVTKIKTQNILQTGIKAELQETYEGKNLLKLSENSHHLSTVVEPIKWEKSTVLPTVISGYSQDRVMDLNNTPGFTQEVSQHAQKFPDSDIPPGHAKEYVLNNDIPFGHIQEKGPDDPHHCTLSTPGIQTPVLRWAFHLSNMALNDTRRESTDCVWKMAEVIPVNLPEDSPATQGKLDSLLGSKLWMETLASPVSLPQFNSTLLNSIVSSSASLDVKESDTEQVAPLDEYWLGQKEDQGLPVSRAGPLQEQLRHIAELLIQASGNIVAGPCPTECHSATTWTSPVLMTEHSVNTSGLFEHKGDFSVAEASTSTDSLLWNLDPGSLDLVSRQQLEQRLTSTLIMVEVLSQQLASARDQNHSCGPGPSNLRDKLIQTDHTELNQVVLYKELYVKALKRVQILELDQQSLQKLLQCMQSLRTTMVNLTGSGELLSMMNEFSEKSRDDQDTMSKQMCQMKTLYGKCQESLRRMGERTRRALQEKDHMKQQMEEAFRVKEAALELLEQLRSRHAAQIVELQQSVGSHQELLAVLKNTYQEQVTLNKEYVETLQAADKLIKANVCDQSSVCKELSTARDLLQRTHALLLKLHEKAASTLSRCKEQEQERNQAVEEKNQILDQLTQTNSSLHDAEQQIGDLNLQVTIMNSEMAVLRQRLSEMEQEHAQIEMRGTELSATLSSTQASYAFLQQALTAETHRAQQSLEEAQHATEQADSLDAMLRETQQQMEKLVAALADREQRVSELQAEAQMHSQQLQHLQEIQEQLFSMKEMNEFLQAESKLSREQVLESEGLLKSHLQGLRERNLECEDLKRALSELRFERAALQEELDCTQAKARSMLLDLGEQLAMASTDVTLLHHRVQGLTNSLQDAVCEQKPDNSCEGVLQLPAPVPRHTAGSFVGTVMVAIAAEEGQVSDTDVGKWALGSGNSAFTRISPVTPKKDEEEQSTVVEQLASLGEALSELTTSISQLQQLKDREQEQLQETVASLQRELHSLTCRHRSEVADLREQVASLQAQVEKDTVALKHKAQEEKTLKKLCSEMDESRELFEQHRSENKELRREVSELRRSLQQAQLEVQVLREELSSSQSGGSLPALEEKILMHKEMDKLRRSLAEAEDSRSKLLERAKRHQLVHESNQRKLERELLVLDQMIETVREQQGLGLEHY
ncbi:hypothetical protein MATL_G00227100 [Megalops atlanticus]|uniref:Sperm-associated antigen 5 n=1 Tax=Megalops atlanticus TaxID=7932 RepID=A0A9D3PH59_MEGAT|nr:hypothetical protein MATL_G00227100 [Megalops atlanticus]